MKYDKRGLERDTSMEKPQSWVIGGVLRDVLPVGVGRFASNKVAESVEEKAQRGHQAKGDEGLFRHKYTQLLLGRHKLRVIKW